MIVVALGSGILGIAVGGMVAWFITRSDLKCKNSSRRFFVFPYMMPAWTLALFWTNMFQNSRVGGGNIGMVESIFGVCMPEWFVYGLFPMIIVTGLHYLPFAYLLIGGILKNMDATLEESATILKASRATIIRRVTIDRHARHPLDLPADLLQRLQLTPYRCSSARWSRVLRSPPRWRADSGLSGAGLHHRVCLHPAGLPDSGRQPALHRQAQIPSPPSPAKSGPGFAGSCTKVTRPISILLIVFTAFFAIMPLISLRAGIRHPSAWHYSPSNMTLHFWIGTEDSAYETGMIAGILLNTTMWSALLRQVCCCWRWSSPRLSAPAAIRLCLRAPPQQALPHRGKPRVLPVSHARDGVRDHLPRRRHIREFQIPLWHLRRAGAGASIKFLPFASRSGVTT